METLEHFQHNTSSCGLDLFSTMSGWERQKERNNNLTSTSVEQCFPLSLTESWQLFRWLKFSLKLAAVTVKGQDLPLKWGPIILIALWCMQKSRSYAPLLSMTSGHRGTPLYISETKLSLSQALSSSTADLICSQSLLSSDREAEPQYQVHPPACKSASRAQCFILADCLFSYNQII